MADKNPKKNQKAPAVTPPQRPSKVIALPDALPLVQPVEAAVPASAERVWTRVSADEAGGSIKRLLNSGEGRNAEIGPDGFYTSVEVLR